MIIVLVDEAKAGILHISHKLLRMKWVPYGELNWWELWSCLQAMKDINEASSLLHFNVSFLPALSA
jgi:hypothetical protein